MLTFTNLNEFKKAAARLRYTVRPLYAHPEDPMEHFIAVSVPQRVGYFCKANGQGPDEGYLAENQRDADAINDSRSEWFVA